MILSDVDFLIFLFNLNLSYHSGSRITKSANCKTLTKLCSDDSTNVLESAAAQKRIKRWRIAIYDHTVSQWISHSLLPDILEKTTHAEYQTFFACDSKTQLGK